MKTYDTTISPWDRLASTQQDSPAHLTRCFTMEVCSWGRKRQNRCGNAFEILSGVNLLLLVNCLTVCYRSKMQLHAITFGFGWLNFAESGLFENVPGIHRVMDKILPVLQSHLPEWLVLSIVCIYLVLVTAKTAWKFIIGYHWQPRYHVEVMDLNPCLVYFN